MFLVAGRGRWVLFCLLFVGCPTLGGALAGPVRTKEFKILIRDHTSLRRVSAKRPKLVSLSLTRYLFSLPPDGLDGSSFFFLSSYISGFYFFSLVLERVMFVLTRNRP